MILETPNKPIRIAEPTFGSLGGSKQDLILEIREKTMKQKKMEGSKRKTNSRFWSSRDEIAAARAAPSQSYL